MHLHNRNMNPIILLSQYSLTLNKELFSLGEEVDVLLSFASKKERFLQEESSKKFSFLNEVKSIEEGISLIEETSHVSFSKKEKEFFVSFLASDISRSIRYAAGIYISFLLAKKNSSLFSLLEILLGNMIFSPSLSTFLFKNIDLAKVPTPLVYYDKNSIIPINVEVYGILSLMKEIL